MGLFSSKKYSLKDIERIEKEFNISLPEEYKTQILNLFDVNYSHSYISVPKLGKVTYRENLSLNKKSKYSIYDIYGIAIKDTRYFPFAETEFGDFYCIDLKDNQIVLWQHETNKAIIICNSFNHLLKLIKNN